MIGVIGEYFNQFRHFLIKNILNIKLTVRVLLGVIISKIKLKDILIAENNSYLFGKHIFYQKYNIAEIPIFTEEFWISKMKLMT